MFFKIPKCEVVVLFLYQDVYFILFDVSYEILSQKECFVISSLIFFSKWLFLQSGLTKPATRTRVWTWLQAHTAAAAGSVGAELRPSRINVHFIPTVCVLVCNPGQQACWQLDTPPLTIHPGLIFAFKEPPAHGGHDPWPLTPHHRSHLQSPVCAQKPFQRTAGEKSKGQQIKTSFLSSPLHVFYVCHYCSLL